MGIFFLINWRMKINFQLTKRNVKLYKLLFISYLVKHSFKYVLTLTYLFIQFYYKRETYFISHVNY